MKTTPKSNHPIISQTEKNTTLWVGQLQSETKDRLAGQTFKCPSEGTINNIQVYSASVQQPGEMALTLHEFDNSSKTWGPAIADATLSLEKGDDSKWIRFDLKPISLVKNNTYGFRLKTNNAMIGLGEAVSHSKKPFLYGHVWNADSKNQNGNFFQYFSLAFKVELCA